MCVRVWVEMNMTIEATCNRQKQIHTQMHCNKTPKPNVIVTTLIYVNRLHWNSISYANTMGVCIKNQPTNRHTHHTWTHMHAFFSRRKRDVINIFWRNSTKRNIIFLYKFTYGRERKRDRVNGKHQETVIVLRFSNSNDNILFLFHLHQ